LISGIVESTQFQRRQRPTVGRHPNRTDRRTACPEHRAELRMQP
jgi:hypothetical protein